MANPAHLAILSTGVAEWNEWRDAQPKRLMRGIFVDSAGQWGPDLSGADLHSAALPNINFSGANLSRTNFGGAELSGADIEEAQLSGATLVGAKLNGVSLLGSQLCDADLRTADLYEASLAGADLRGANLFEADLRFVDLRGADLTGANLRSADIAAANFTACRLTQVNFTDAGAFGTLFGDVDISGALGLETIRHGGPLTIGLDTIHESKGKIPEVFLRGCGLSDWEIEAAKLYDPSLSASAVTDAVYRVANLRNSQPFRYYSCFISY